MNQTENESKIPLDVKDLHVSYRKREVLKGVNLTVRKGSVNVILGRNGCGKTTLIRSIVGLQKYAEGDILIFGRRVEPRFDRGRAKVVAYVSQYNSVGDFTVRDFLLAGTASEFGITESPREEQQKRVDDLLRRMGLEDFADRIMSQLSGGETQKIAICAALVQDSEMIILDEPLSALDMGNQGTILKLLKEIATDGKTILMSTHDPNHALYLGANVFLMCDGTVIDQGPAEEVVRPERLRSVYDNVCFSDELGYRTVSLR